MASIDAIEIVLGILGLAGGIYDPWVGDVFAPVWVTFARTAGVISLLLSSGVALIVLLWNGQLDCDPTTLATIVFAVGSSAPITARGVWSLMDMGTMFGDVMHISYIFSKVGIPSNQGTPTNGTPPTASATPAGNARRQTPSRVGAVGVAGFATSFVALWITLMKHNISFHMFYPYMVDLYRSFANNVQKFIHGKPVYDRTPANEQWKWDWRGWAARAKALLNIIIFNPMVFLFVCCQAIAALGEAVILGIGSGWIAVALAAHMDVLEDHPSEVTPDTPLDEVVTRLICCRTCIHLNTCDGRLYRTSEGDNEKLLTDVMPHVTAKSLGDRTNAQYRVCGWARNLNGCTCFGSCPRTSGGIP